VLRTASQRLDDSDLEVAELALRRPSLDEVFFSLTGHPAEERSDDEGSPA
jgi:oleandomycin transport system ATP-binding protein